jgi:hypothetical protein
MLHRSCLALLVLMNHASRAVTFSVSWPDGRFVKSQAVCRHDGGCSASIAPMMALKGGWLGVHEGLVGHDGGARTDCTACFGQTVRAPPPAAVSPPLTFATITIYCVRLQQ